MNKVSTTDLADTPTERLRQGLESAGFVVKGELRPDMTDADVIKALESLVEQFDQIQEARA